MKYSGIDAWNELVGTCYTETDKNQIEKIIECAMLGMLNYISSHWIILLGDAGTGKSTLIHNIGRILPQLWTPITQDSQDFGQYSKMLAISYGGDVNKIYRNVKENWAMSKDTYFLLETNKLPDFSKFEDEYLLIEPTGERVPFEKYQELTNIICENLRELHLYFQLKAENDFMNKLL